MRRRATRLASLVAAVILCGAVAAADARAQESPGTSPAAVADSTHAGRDSTADTTAAGPRARRGPFVMPPLREALFGHMHNKLVHFPIVLGLGGLVLLLLAGRRPELLPVAHAVIWLAAASSIAAYFSGRLQEKEFVGRPKEWLGRLHERWGTAVTLTYGAWAALTGLKPGWRARALVLGIVAVGLMLVTAFFGGVLAHGH